MNPCLLAKRVVIIYCVCIVALMIAPFAGLLEPQPPFDDMYFGYFWISGPVVWVIGAWGGAQPWSMLARIFGAHTASVLTIVILPGLIDLVLGSLQWYGVIRLFCWIRARRNKAVPS